MKKLQFALSILLLLAMSLSVTVSAFTLADQTQTLELESESESERIPTWDDVYAGIVDPRDMYDPLDAAAVPDIIGYETACERSHVKRLYNEEPDLCTVIFLNANGTKTVYFYDFPVKYVDENGEIKDISLAIESDSNAFGAFETAGNSIQTTFSRNLTDGIGLSSEDISIRLIPLPAKETIVASSKLNASSSLVSSSIAKKIDEEIISYDYDDKTTIEYALTYTGFKEDIVVSEYTGQTAYDFTLKTNGLALSEHNGSFYLVNSVGKIQANIGDIIIFTADGRNNTFGYLTARTVTENQEYVLTVHVDKDFLLDKNTVYPIRIDPTIEINYDTNGSGAIEDVTINSLQGSDGSSSSLFIGKRETYGISRVLMRFPTLSLTEISTPSNIESATIELQDVLCEDTAMSVYCHVFTGNIWTESTADWSSVNPDQYIATAVSTNVVYYSNGAKQAVAHRYQFNITSAVKGWKLGNYSQAKGLIFKASATVENASSNLHKTFASYNRSSKKPSLSITYNSDTQSGILKDDIYYINNQQHGKYLRYASSAISASSGLLSSLGSSIRWKIQKVDGGYVLRSHANTNNYLGVSSSNTTGVTYYTVSNSAIPKECIWTISIGENGGCLIKSNAKSDQVTRYLYNSGSSLYVSSTLGTADTSTYRSRVWRIASTSYYGNTSSYTARELTASSAFFPFSEKVAFSKVPALNKAFSNEVWCAASDFTYSITDSSIASIESLGYIEGLSEGETSATATHKVTGRTTEFDISIFKLLIYQTADTEYHYADGTLAKDMLCGDLSENELRELEWLNWMDFVGYTPKLHRFDWESMCKSFSIGDLQTVVLDMIDHFMGGSGAEYSNNLLTNAVLEHDNTQTYIIAVKELIDNFLNTNKGEISLLSYQADTRDNNPLVLALSAANVNQPVYNTAADILEGLKICIDGLWGNKIEVSSFQITNNTYSCTLHFTLYDHFGLDEIDVETFGFFAGFRSWYILQHYDMYYKNYRPFLTLIEFDETLTGTF